MRAGQWSLTAILFAPFFLTTLSKADEFEHHIGDVPSPLTSIPDQLTTRYADLVQPLQPSLRLWIKNQARIELGRPGLDLSALRAAIVSRFVPNRLSDIDIETLAFIVLMEASKTASNDLKQDMDQVKSANRKKAEADASLRTKIVIASDAAKKAAPAPCIPPCVSDIKVTPSSGAIIHKVAPATSDNSVFKTQLNSEISSLIDSLADLSQEDQMRLQMMMDRRTRFLEACSNMMKKTSGTSSDNIKNLK